MKIERLSPEWRPVPFQNTRPNLFVSTQVTKELKIWRLSPEWQTSAFSKYSSNFIYFHKGHKRTEFWKVFTWTATDCLYKILDQIHLLPHRSQKNWKLEGFHLNGKQVLFKILYQICLLPYRAQKRKIGGLSPEWRPSVNLFVSTQVTKKLKHFHLHGDQLSFQNTLPNLFVSRQVTKELKIGRHKITCTLSPFLVFHLTKFVDSSLIDKNFWFVYIFGRVF